MTETRNPLGDEIRPVALLPAIWEFLHETADAAGKSRLVELTEAYGQEVADTFKHIEQPTEKSKKSAKTE